MRKTVYLSNNFGNQIITRNSIRLFLDLLSNASNKELILDFKDISFISRSCADEYIKWKLSLSGKKNIIEINMSNEVRMMFKLVSLQYKKNSSLTI